MHCNALILNILTFFESSKAILVNVVEFLRMSAKLATLDLLKIKILMEIIKVLITSLYDVTNSILSHGSNYIVDAVILSKFDNSSISMRSYRIQFYKDLTRKTNFFEGCCWLKFSNLGLALGMASKFYTSVTKGLKLKIGTIERPISTFVEATGEKLVGGGPFWASPT